MLKKIFNIFVFILLFVEVFAGDSSKMAKSVGDMAVNLDGNLEAVESLIISVGQVMGVGFVVSSIFKFKQFKDNPTQVQIGAPISLLVIGVFLSFLPALFKPASKSIYGHDVELGKASYTKSQGEIV